MRRVRIEAGGGYDVIIGPGAVDNAGVLAGSVLKGRKVAVAVDPAVAGGGAGCEVAGGGAMGCGAGCEVAGGGAMGCGEDGRYGYGRVAAEALKSAGFEVYRYEMPAGEVSKSIYTVADFAGFLARHRFTRQDAVVAVGGGVTGDAAGFTAAVYMRGIRYIQVPTTLLAAVDSSVGGKTGVNIGGGRGCGDRWEQAGGRRDESGRRNEGGRDYGSGASGLEDYGGKNMIGAFWQPEMVICDTDVLKSLGAGEILDGTAEIVKTGAIFDRELLEFCGSNDIMAHCGEIIERCVRIKGSIVEADEREAGLRRILNFGHTFGHAIEMASRWKIGHGRAVAMGMDIVTAASERRGLTEKGTYRMLHDILVKKGFELEIPVPVSELCRLAAADKKADGDSVCVVYVRRPGKAETADIKLAKLEEFMR